MKKLLKYTILSILVAFMGCDDDEYTPPSETPSNIHVTTGFGTGTPIVQVNGYESFADLSIGVESRQWNFPGGDVTDVTTSTEDVLQVTFSQTGTYEVTLNLDFLEPPYDWRTQSVRASDKIDTTLVVTVVDSVKADFEIFYIAVDGSDSTQLNVQSGALNQLMAGESIRIKDNSIGAPTVWEFTSEGGSPAFTQITDASELPAEIKYKRLGTYDLTLNPYRTKPQGSDVLILTDFIQVIPSTRPVELEDVFRWDDNVVALSFSRSIAEPMNEEPNFTVRAKNPDVRDNSGIPFPFDEILPVESVTVAPGDDDNIVLLTLGDNIYNSDTVWVSYTPGAITTTDGIAADAFSEVLLDWKRENIAAEYGGFENNGMGWVQLEEIRTDAGYGTFEFTNERVYEGNLSLKLSTVRDANDDPQWIEVITDVNLDDPDAADAYNAVAVNSGDKFYISYQTYVEWTDPISPNEWEALDMYLWLMWDKLKIHEYRLGVTPVYPIGQWNKIEGVWGGLGGALEPAVLRPYFRTIGNITVFVDDLIIYEYETRPFGG